MKNIEKRINIITGQLEGIKKMIDEGKDPLSVLTQFKAARSALDSCMSSYINEHFWQILESCDDKEATCKRFLEELIIS